MCIFCNRVQSIYKKQEDFIETEDEMTFFRYSGPVLKKQVNDYKYIYELIKN